ncbi:transcriptional regulator GutM [Brevibacillus laterosporus]|uniref:transcriptional regulator GutM n=1 Tax=Brevibacillus laterosporus TaxID=1465 RepID=UPI0035A6D9ED
MMGLWGAVLFFFIGMWLCQIYFTLRQVKHYRQSIDEMKQQRAGFLGVGVQKNRLSIGSVVILTTHPDGSITRCKRMTGVTVFATFKEVPELIGKKLEDCYPATPVTPEEKALQIAIQQIDLQRKQLQRAKTAFPSTTAMEGDAKSIPTLITPITPR